MDVIRFFLAVVTIALLSYTLSLFPFSSSSSTTYNTLRNTRENGGTGAQARSERTRRGFRRRQWSDSEEDDDDDDDSREKKGKERIEYRVKSTPTPVELRGVLKKVRRKESNNGLLATTLASFKSDSSRPASPSSTSTSVSPAFLAPFQPSPSSETNTIIMKQVRLVEPSCKFELERLRAHWYAPPPAAAKNGSSLGGGGMGGIGGYRQTRSIYMKGQGKELEVKVDSPVQGRAGILADQLDDLIGGLSSSSMTATIARSLSTVPAIRFRAATRLNLSSSSTSSSSSHSSSSLLARSSSPSFANNGSNRSSSANGASTSTMSNSRRRRSNSTNGVGNKSVSTSPSTLTKSGTTEMIRLGSRLRPREGVHVEDDDEDGEFEDVMDEFS